MVHAEVRIGATADLVPDVCLECLRLNCLQGKPPFSEILVFNAPVYNTGSRAPTKAMRRTANRREEKLAKAIGGRKQPASGALPHAKGDVRRMGEWVGDDKTCRTINKGFRLELDFITKIRSWCGRGEKFFITIGFLDPITQRVLDEVVVLDRHVFEERIEHAHVDR